LPAPSTFLSLEKKPRRSLDESAAFLSWNVDVLIVTNDTCQVARAAAGDRRTERTDFERSMMVSIRTYVRVLCPWMALTIQRRVIEYLLTRSPVDADA
jgi:hypothetical protein